MDNAQAIIDMIDKITAGDNTAAQDDFNNLIAPKLQNALDIRKQEIAQSIYSNTTQDEVVDSDEETEEDNEEEVVEDGSDKEKA